MNIKNTLPYRMLRKLRHQLNIIVATKSAAELEHYNENKNDKFLNLYPEPIVDLAIKKFKKENGIFAGFALVESSVRSLLHFLIKDERAHLHICEFGGGQSTIFWNVLSNFMDLSVTTYEHDPEWAQYLIDHIDNKRIQINSCELRQIPEEMRKMMFTHPGNALNIWKEHSIKIEPAENKNSRFNNGFYNIGDHQFPVGKIDAFVVDGPHGNGRSICFPLFYEFINPGTLILLDDYHHYPFLDDLGIVFDFEIIEKRIYTNSNKGWVVLKILNKKI